jgi:predicted P-loop ATPase
LPQPLGDYTPREWRSIDDARLAEWLQLEGIQVGPGVAATAVEVVANEHGFNPVRKYLGGLVWDGTRRLNGWLSTYLGVKVTLYTVGVGMRWMVSAVARIDDPGCKADHVLILEGDQGPGKSSALEILGGPWFSDQLSSLDSKDSSGDLQGAWIIELGELDSIAKADIPRVKQYLSRRVDRYRPPYGRRVESFPRRCVFAGTHNPSGPWDKDATGGRRFWPVKVGKIDLEALKRDRDQLWAEAVRYYIEDFNWWITDPQELKLAEDEQSARQEHDPWHDIIADFLETDSDVRHDGWVKVERILAGPCELNVPNRNPREASRVVKVLTSLVLQPGFSA